MTTQTITKSVYLPEDWEANEHALFKQYMSEVYTTNQAINDIFDDPNLKVVSMDLEINVHVKEAEVPTEDGSTTSFAESIATSLINDAIDSPIDLTDSLDSSSE